MNTEIRLISENHKFLELSEVIPNLVKTDLDLPEVQAVDSREVIAAKLSEARKRFQDGNLLVEDTALHLACLNGFPGALIKWMLTSVGCAGLYRLCDSLGDYRAEARTALGYLAANSDTPCFFEAAMEGTICAPAGQSGFGWDPIFVPTGYDVSLAELPENVLRSIKMRRHAAIKLADHLKTV